MTHNININKNQPNTIEFDVVIEKLEAKDVLVRFIVSLPKYNALLECKNEGGDKWSVELPVLPIEGSSSNFRVEVVASDFFFIAAEGTLTLVDQEEKAEKKEDTKAIVANIEVNPSEESKEESKEEKKEEKKEVKETANASAVVKKILNEHAIETKKKIEKPKSKKFIKSTTPPIPKPAIVKEDAPIIVEQTEADKKVKEVLKSLHAEEKSVQKPKVVIQKGSIVTITS